MNFRARLSHLGRHIGIAPAPLAPRHLHGPAAMGISMESSTRAPLRSKSCRSAAIRLSPVAVRDLMFALRLGSRSPHQNPPAHPLGASGPLFQNVHRSSTIAAPDHAIPAGPAVPTGHAGDCAGGRFGLPMPLLIHSPSIVAGGKLTVESPCPREARAAPAPEFSPPRRENKTQFLPIETHPPSSQNPCRR